MTYNIKTKIKSKVQFVIDAELISRDHSALLIRILQEEKIKFMSYSADLNEHMSTVFFVEKKNLRKISRFKNKFIVIPEDDQESSLSIYKLNFNSYEDILSFMESFFLAEKKVDLQDRLSESLQFYEKTKAFLETKNPADNFFEISKLYESLLDLELALLKEETTASWNNHFKLFIKKNVCDLSSLQLVESSELLNDDVLILDENTIVLKLTHVSLFLCFRFKNLEIKKDAATIELMLALIMRTLGILDQKLVKSEGEIDFWKKIFSKIPYPMAVISSLGDLLVYNESFAKIGILPKECQRFKDQESVEFQQNFYKVRRIDFPINLIDVSYFVFYTSEKDQTHEIHQSGERVSKNKASIDDLGIISSSIAHELNNPLAGILAALSLLSLEDNWTDEAKTDLQDMKNGAKRCKELVEIFLGFSKFSPASSALPSIKDSLDQAINLLRFRMIESNLRLEMKYSPTLERFSYQVNSSIMSMILYLICSELMTAFAHHRLITQNHHGLLSGEVLEFSNQIVIKLDFDFEYEDKIAQAKLIQHLLIFEKLEINFMKQELRLIYRS